MYNRPTVIWGFKVGRRMVMVDAESIRQAGRFARQECVAAPGTVQYTYYDSSWQAIETRTNGTANSNVTSQMVWSAAYINASVLQDTYSGGIIQPNNRLYFAQDANWDPGAVAHTRESGTGFRAVEAEYANELSRSAGALNTTTVIGYNAISDTWQVMQRYVYSPYGTITILNANWSATPTGTVPLVNNLFQGMAESDTGTQLVFDCGVRTGYGDRAFGTVTYCV